MENMKNKRLIIIVVAAIILALVCGSVIFSNSPARKVKEQLELGQKYLTELKYEEAIACFDKALEIDRNNTSVQDAIIDTYCKWSKSIAETGDYDKAIEIIDVALNRFPENESLLKAESDIQIMYADSLVREDDYSEAISAVEAFAETNSSEVLSAKLEEFREKQRQIEEKVDGDNITAEVEAEETVTELSKDDLAYYIGKSLDEAKANFPGGDSFETDGEEFRMSFSSFYQRDGQSKSIEYEYGEEGITVYAFSTIHNDPNDVNDKDIIHEVYIGGLEYPGASSPIFGLNTDMEIDTVRAILLEAGWEEYETAIGYKEDSYDEGYKYDVPETTYDEYLFRRGNIGLKYTNYYWDGELADRHIVATDYWFK